MVKNGELVRVAGRELKLTNLGKVLWPEDGISKAEVIKYYAEVGKHMIPFVRDRPLMAQRYPHGIAAAYFVQKHFTAVPPWIKRVTLASHGADKGDFILCNELPALVWLANLAAIEINHMLARVPKITRQDMVLIDLDPHPPATFGRARIIARGVASLLERLDLEFLLKTSGSGGFHFFIPIRPAYSVEKIRRFVYVIGKFIEKASPKIATVSNREDRKRGRVYVDFLQNALEKTITAPFSIRALPKAPVSFPIEVKELDDSKLGPTRYTVRTAPLNLRRARGIEELANLQQDLSPAFRRLGIKT